MLYVLCTASAFSQPIPELFKSVDSLREDISTLLEMKGLDADSASSRVVEVVSTLNSQQKEIIFRTSAMLVQKNYAFRPDMLHYYQGISNAVHVRSVPSGDLTKYLEIAETVVKSYNRNLVSNFLKNSYAFFRNEVIFKSRFSSVRLLAGNFSFDHVYDEKNLLSNAEMPADTLGTDMAPVDEATAEEEESGDDWYDGVSFDEESEEEEVSPDEWSTASDAWETEEATSDGWETDPEPEPFEVEESPVSFSFTPDYELPARTGPILNFENVKMVVGSIYDTITIENVNGSLLLKNNILIGENAKVNWEGVEIPKEELFAILKVFTFDVEDAEINGYEAELHYPEFIEGPVEGSFNYDSHLHNKFPKKAIYPQFRSFGHNVKVKGLIENMNITGGFALQGTTFLSDSETKGTSVAEYLEEGRKKFTAASRKPFMYADSLLTNPLSELTVHYSEEDSIFHPAVMLKYHASDKLLQARRDKHGYQMSRFTDTRSDVSVIAEFMQWYVEADTFDLTILNARERIPLVVESKDYYDENLYLALRGTYSFHPINLAVSYALNVAKEPEFYVADLANHHKLNLDVVQGAMIAMDKRGFLDYNHDTGKVIVNRKAVFYYFIAMGRKGVDFDNMRIPSRTTDKPNLTVSLDSANFQLEGVSQFMISDSMQVLVTPQDGKVNLKDGRNTSFGGEMKAGNFIFRGAEFNYEYDSSKVELDAIDSISVLVTRENGQKKELANNIVNTGGVLYISSPNNKSGKKKSDKYPLLDAKAGGTIFFDGDEILGGRYDRSVRFEMPPFKIDSLNENNTDVITFDGTFKTAGMFPDFEQRISIDKTDYSFGFTKDFGSTKTPIYNGKAQYSNQIKLNNSGIRGKGKIDYLAGNFTSDDFTFFIDSVKAPGKNGEIAFQELNGVSYPSVKMEQYQMRWLVSADSMELTSSEEQPFEIFDPETSFAGTLILGPRSLNGEGKIETPESINESKHFTMEGTNYNSINSNFKIKSDDPNRPAMIGEYVEVDYDLSERMALIKTQDELSNFTFPYTKFRTNISQVRWNLDQNYLSMTVDDDNEMGLGRFVSENSKQDSVEILASNATYDLNEHVMNLEGVPSIMIANMRVIPDSGKVYIRENAKMDELQNAMVEMNAINRYHMLTDATIRIESGKKLEGQGVYHYTLGIEDTVDLTFSDFDIKTIKEGKGEKQYQTTVSAKIDEDQAFAFMPGVKFKGQMNLVDTDEYPHFEGVATLDIDRPDNRWFSYQSNSKETHGMILVDDNLKEAGFPTKLTSGIFLSRIDRELYATLVEFDRERVRDFPIFEANGQLLFDPEKQEYSIIPPEKRDGRTDKGNSYIFNWEAQKNTFEGKLNLAEPEKDYSFLAAGEGKADLNAGEFDLSATVHISFDGASKATDQMGIILQELTDGDDPAVAGEEKIGARLAQIREERQVMSFLDAFGTGEESWGKLFSDGLTLANVDLKWSSEQRAFYSVGNIGMGNIFKDNVNAVLEGYVEFPKQISSSEVKIFLMYDRDNWYYFSFNKDAVTSLSSDGTYNYELTGKGASGVLQPAPLDDVLGFISQFRLNYLGTDELLDIAMPEETTPFAGGGAPTDDPFADEVFEDMAKDAEPAATEEGEEEEEDDGDGF